MSAPQTEFQTTLPVGYTDDGGRIHREAWLRKMTGHEEALIADANLSAGQLVTELLRCCLVKLGEIDTVDADLVSRLYTADRNYLLLELRRITFGARLLEFYVCPHCGVELSVEEDLSEIPVRRLTDGQTPGDIDITLEDGYTDRHGTRHQQLRLTLPRGCDEEFVSPMLDKDPLQAQDALLLRCIKQFGTLPQSELSSYGIKVLRDLTLGDRQRLQRAFSEQAPGVDFQREISCGSCGATFTGVMDVSNFFVLS